jgi:hypothetical protein
LDPLFGLDVEELDVLAVEEFKVLAIEEEEAEAREEVIDSGSTEAVLLSIGADFDLGLGVDGGAKSEALLLLDDYSFFSGVFASADVCVIK